VESRVSVREAVSAGRLRLAGRLTEETFGRLLAR
jgi:hypothetical protein